MVRLDRSSLDLGLGQHPLIGLSAMSVIQARVVGLLKPPLFAIGSVASKTHTALCLLWCKVVTFTHSSLLEYSSLIRLDCCTASHFPGGSQLMLSCPCIGGKLALETGGRNAAHDGTPRGTGAPRPVHPATGRRFSGAGAHPPPHCVAQAAPCVRQPKSTHKYEFGHLGSFRGRAIGVPL